MNESAQNRPGWRAALYIRLSREDGHDESYSVKNQRDLLLEYAGSRGGEFEVAGIYADDGHTGTDSERAGFLSLLKDVKSRKVNCVIVKDLSRLSRNYWEAGFYLEQLFLSLDVRFISLEAPALDSYRDPGRMNSILVPLQNVINDDFCRQTSLKIRGVLDSKRRRGEFIGAFAPYGYRKDPADRHRLLIDEEAARVVRDIYGWFVRGASHNGIVRRLNALGIPCPSAYKLSSGLSYRNPNARPDTRLWCAATVRRILTDRTYLGDLVQGRFRVKSYKVHTQIRTPESEWFIVPGSHEPVVSAELFQRAQELQKRTVHIPPACREPALFSGFLRCADCGKSMSRSKMKNRVYYYCRTYKDASKAACTRHTIREDRLERAVLAALRLLVSLAVQKEAVAAAVEAFPFGGESGARLSSMLQSRERELERTLFYKRSLYETLRDGDLSPGDYRALRRRYEQREKELRRSLDVIREEAGKPRAGNGVSPDWAAFQKDGSLPSLTRGLLTELVDTISVGENGAVRIHLRCSDPLPHFPP